MAAVTANQALDIRNPNSRSRYSRTVKTGEIIYRHTFVLYSLTDKLAYSGNKFTATTMRYAGISDSPGPLTGDGTRVVELFDDVEVLATLKTGVTKGHAEDAMHIYDNFSVSQLTTHGPQCGALVDWVSATKGWVKLRRNALADGT